MPARRKATDDQIREAYARLGSIWKVGEELGMGGQTVQERLVRLGVPRNDNSAMSQEEIDLIREFYARGFARGDGQLSALAKTMGRSVTTIARKARILGLTDQKRSVDSAYATAMGTRTKAFIAKNGHPRGALGIKHTPQTLTIISRRSKTAWDRLSPDERVQKVTRMMKAKYTKYGTLAPNVRRGSWKAGWRTIGGKKHYYRSRWEANYACYLEWLKQKRQIKEWETEPQVFWFEKIKRGVRSYLPDFRVTELDGTQKYVEVKGWMDSRSRTTIKRMAKYYPDVKLEVVDSTAYKALAKMGRLYGFE